MSDKTFSQVLNFTRPDPGTYYDSAGVLQTAAIDEPRFTHDPVTLESLGLLIEEQRTNLLLWSEAFDNAVWTTSELSVAADAGISPEGLMNADKLVESANNATHAVFQFTSTTVGNSYSLSVFCKASERTEMRLQAGGTAFNNQNISVNLSNGTITSSSGVSTPSVTPLPDGWYRISFSVTSDTTASGTLSVRPMLSGVDSYQGDGSSGIFVWGAQVEQASTPSSYIKTEASQVTRSADNCTRTLGSEYNNSDFTVYCDFDWDGQGSGSRYLWAISQGANNSQTRLALRVNVNSQRVEAIVSVGGTITLVTPVPEFIAQIGSNTAALSLSSSGDIVIAVNGQTETLTDPGTFGSANLLTVGSLPGGQSVWNGPVPLIKMEPRANTEEFLAEATA